MSGTGKFALVTGAGSGIGRTVALALVGAGYGVALAGRRREALEETAAEASARGGRTLVVPTDVGDPVSVDALFAEIRQGFGRLDVLFNNAGMNGPTCAVEDLEYEAWQQVVAVNLTGVFLCAQGAFRLMKSQTPKGGRIINNGSISAHAPRPMQLAYVATKHAVTGITKSLALDGRAHDIACGQIDIGNAQSKMTERMASGVLQANGSRAPEPRMDVDHVGEAVVHMASLPLATNVLFMTVMATNMPFVGRG